MIPLEYTVAIVGDRQIKSVLRGIEGEAKASAARVDRSLRSVAGGGGRGGADNEAKARARAEASLDRQRSTALVRQYSEEQRLARRSEAEKLRSIRKRESEEVRSARRVADARVRSAASMGRGVARTAINSTGRAVGLVGGAMALGGALLGGVGISGAIDDEIQTRAAASRLANQAGDPRLKGQLHKESGQLKGFTRGEALGGLEQFTNITGDLKAAREILPDLGRLALATGADLGELGATAGNAFIPIADQIKNVNDPAAELRERMSALRDVMAAIAGQGAVGAVEIKDLASGFAGLAASSNRFAGSRADLMKKMGAITQAARQRGGAASASEAVTSTERFASDLISKSGKLGKMGVDVFSDKTHTSLKDPEQILVDVLKKTKGDLTKVGDIFGERGIRAVQGFSPLYTNAEAKKKGSGADAVHAEFARLMGAQKSAAEQAVLAQSRLADEDIRAKEAMKQFNIAIGSKLMPTLTALVPEFEKMIPSLVDLAGAAAHLAEFFVNNPFLGIGAIVTASIAHDLASAGIAAVVESGMASIFARVAAAGGASALVSGASGLLGAGANAGAGALGLGAAGAGGLALGAAGAGAGIGVGLAAWQGSKLMAETQADGGIWEAIKGSFKGPSRASTPEEYDRIYGPKSGGAAGGTAAVDATSAASKQLEESAAKAGDIIGNVVAEKLAMANVGPNSRRTATLVAR